MYYRIIVVKDNAIDIDDVTVTYYHELIVLVITLITAVSMPTCITLTVIVTYDPVTFTVMTIYVAS